MKIGLIGFGNVGKSFLQLLEDRKEHLASLNIDCSLVFVLNSIGGIYSPEGLDIPSLSKIEKSGELLNHPEGKKVNWEFISSLSNKDVDIVIEVTPSTMTYTDEPTQGYIHCKTFLEKGVHVVTGNKAPVANSYDELNNIARDNNVSFGIGCTTGGALPSFICGTYGTAGSDITEIQGVLNGSTNYILSLMEDKGFGLDDAINECLHMGILETDYSYDVGGFDTATKLTILGNILFGKSDDDILDINVEGLYELNSYMINEAKKKRKKYKLLGTISKDDNILKLDVRPQLLDNTHPLFNINGKNKGLTFKTSTLGDITVSGGASSPYNAAASLLRDIVNIYNG